MASAPEVVAPATNPISATLALPSDPNARVDLPHLSCEPVLGVFELAVLYAAGHQEAARQGLEQICVQPESDRTAWLMLLDLHRCVAHHDRFDAVLAAHRARFPEAPEPLWCMPALPASSNTIQLKGVLGEPELSDLMSQARQRRVVVLDFSEVTRIAFAAAPALCSGLRLMTLQNKRVIIANIAELHSCLLKAIGLHPEVVVLARRLSGTPAVGSNDGDALAAA